MFCTSGGGGTKSESALGSRERTTLLLRLRDLGGLLDPLNLSSFFSLSLSLSLSSPIGLSANLPRLRRAPAACSVQEPAFLMLSPSLLSVNHSCGNQGDKRESTTGSTYIA